MNIHEHQAKAVLAEFGFGLMFVDVHVGPVSTTAF
jgi:hypothetical protein